MFLIKFKDHGTWMWIKMFLWKPHPSALIQQKKSHHGCWRVVIFTTSSERRQDGAGCHWHFYNRHGYGPRWVWQFAEAVHWTTLTQGSHVYKRAVRDQTAKLQQPQRVKPRNTSSFKTLPFYFSVKGSNKCYSNSSKINSWYPTYNPRL